METEAKSLELGTRCTSWELRAGSQELKAIGSQEKRPSKQEQVAKTESWEFKVRIPELRTKNSEL